MAKTQLAAWRLGYAWEGRTVSLRIYIAYGAAADQATALRLQALGGVNGLTVYVPPAFTRQDPDGKLDARSEERLCSSDIVLGVVTLFLSEACQTELTCANNMKKRTLILCHPAAVEALAPHFAGEFVVFDPSSPAQAESAIVDALRKLGLHKDGMTALLGLATIFLGLLIFAPRE